MVALARVLLVSLLLLFAQQQLLAHALQHDGARVGDTQHTLHIPADGPCVTCALLAGGTHGFLSHDSLAAPRALAPLAPIARRRWVPATPPEFYSTRAPPMLL